MAIVDTIEYSVCEDCLVFVDAGFNDATTAADDDHMEMRMRDELDGRKGHWVAGVEKTEDDPEGYGYDEFSNRQCELCMDGRAGSRHGLTLLIEGEDHGR